MKRLKRNLTDEEYKAFFRLAKKTKMDCWFSIDTVKGRDVVRDTENKKIISLERGISDLYEGLTEPVKNYGLTDQEAEAVENIFAAIGLNDNVYLMKNEEVEGNEPDMSM